MARPEGGGIVTAPVLRFDRVSRHFGGLVAVSDCSFEIQSGDLVGLVGPNGAGKSTVFNLASGYIPATSGSVCVAGEDVAGRSPAELARAGLSRTFQTPVSFLELSVLDNVMAATRMDRPLLSAISGGWRGEEERLRDEARRLLERVGLTERTDSEAAELSGGELRMLEVARQLVNRPRLLLLDEPTAGVAPHLQDSLAELIRSVHADGIAAVVVEHNLRFLLDLVDRVICMANGSIIADGTPDEIRNDPAVISAYLGDHG